MPEAQSGAVVFAASDTVRTANRKLASAFQEAGIESSEADARFLLGGVMGLDGADLIANPDRPLGAKAAALTDAMQRRVTGEPVSRILGVRGFYGRDFTITPDVLDPRPDTETLVDAVLDIAADEGWADRPLLIADIGTGSGVLIVTLLAELPNATGVATDVSPPALAVAKGNAERHELGHRVTFIHTPTLAGVAGPFDIIVSNPPYIKAPDIAGLDPEVRDFDPLLALDGGPDGLSVYREIANEVSRFKGPLWIVLEAGAGQADDIAAIFYGQNPPPGTRRVHFRNDLGGHTRCVAIRIQPE